MPVARVAAAAAIVGDAALLEARGIAQQRGLGLQAAFAFGPEGNLTPMLYIFGAVPLTYLATFLIVPLLSGWLDRLR